MLQYTCERFEWSCIEGAWICPIDITPLTFTSNQLAVSQPYSYGMLKYSDYNIHGPIAIGIYTKLLVW